jgi:starch phosphorylase
VQVQTNAAQHVFEAEVYFNDLDPKLVRVELYASGINDSIAIRQEMTRVQPPTGETRGGIYCASVRATRPAADYTARIIPHCAGVAVPLEVRPILWQR